MELPKDGLDRPAVLWAGDKAGSGHSWDSIPVLFQPR